MGKYDPLRRYLEGREAEIWEAGFDDVENILRFPLPESARRYSAWWANESHGSHSHARSWQDAGWEARNVDLAAKKVRFVRKEQQRQPSRSLSLPQHPQPDDLWDQARRFSGIEDRDKLIEAALLALIQREAGRRLIAMGGTMPEAQAAPRERPFA